MSSVMRELKAMVRGVERCERRRIVAEVNVEIFDLAGPVAAEMRFQPAACGPALTQRAVAEHISGRNDVAIDVDAGAVNGALMLDLAECKPAGAVEQHVRRNRHAEARAHRPEPVQIVLVHHGHRRIEAHQRDGRIADRARAGRRIGRALVSEDDVGLEAGHDHARLPVVTDLGAADAAEVLERGAGGE
jgi:hypothetical protein